MNGGAPRQDDADASRARAWARVPGGGGGGGATAMTGGVCVYGFPPHAVPSPLLKPLCAPRTRWACYASAMGDRESTVNRISFPVDAATRALWERLSGERIHLGHARWVIQLLAEADRADHNAIRNLLYAFRSGQLG
jgi:hypothetical protein